MRTARTSAAARRPLRAGRWILIGLGAVLVLALAAWLFRPISTAPFRDAPGGAAAKSIAVVDWRDLVAYLRGDRFTAAMVPEMSALAFDDRDWNFQAPVYLLSGRYDHRTDGALAEAFLNHMTAPQKGFVWFERSAHSPPFEEPAAFDAWIVDNIRPLAKAR